MSAEIISPGSMLSVRDLTVEFRLRGGQILRAVDSVNLDVGKREVLGLVGESGSGKTVLALAVMRLLDREARVLSGNIFVEEKNVTNMSDSEFRTLRGRVVAMVFQNAAASLNPALKVGRQLRWVLADHHGLSGEQLAVEASELLAAVKLPETQRVLTSYPHELSAGMAQRVALALALACRPRLLIADEPTSSLDVTVAAELIELLRDLQNRFGLSILLISHDLGVVASICDRVSVMWRGQIVESSSAIELYRTPQHPYTQALLRSVPIPDPERRIRPDSRGNPSVIR
jgi:ABC-type dipeptide/oligopeptide/nickel transport system ATPase component